MLDNVQLLVNAAEYAKSRGIIAYSKERLGYGSDGSVWETSRPSAIKVIQRPEVYRKEVECYKRLKKREPA